MALHDACLCGNFEMVKKIVEDDPTSIFKKTIHGCTPLFIASTKGYLDIVRFLVERDAKIFNKNRILPLHAAVLQGHIDVVKYLLPFYALRCAEQGGVNIKDGYGRTPLSVAAHRARIEMVIFLLENGADSNDESVRVAPMNEKIKEIITNWQELPSF